MADIPEHIDDVPELDDPNISLDHESHSDIPDSSSSVRDKKIDFDDAKDNIIDNWREEKYIAHPYLLDKIIRASRVKLNL